jgi:hypothetical protein
MLNWLVNKHGIEPHFPVFDKSQHADGTFSRDDFAYDHKRDCYICPAGKKLRQLQRIYRVPRPLVDRNGMIRYRASKLDCQNCSQKPKCCPNAPARKIPRSIHEGARDMARDIAKTEAYSTSCCTRKKVEMLFAHLKRILKLDRLRLLRPNGARDNRDRLNNLPLSKLMMQSAVPRIWPFGKRAQEISACVHSLSCPLFGCRSPGLLTQSTCSVTFQVALTLFL